MKDILFISLILSAIIGLGSMWLGVEDDNHYQRWGFHRFDFHDALFPTSTLALFLMLVLFVAFLQSTN